MVLWDFSGQRYAYLEQSRSRVIWTIPIYALYPPQYGSLGYDDRYQQLYGGVYQQQQHPEKKSSSGGMMMGAAAGVAVCAVGVLTIAR